MPTDQKSRRRSPRAEAKRELIVTCAMRHFAEHGYQSARIEDMAAELQIAKGSVFQHYGSKAGLFLECYKRAVSMLPAWLDAPDDVKADGFFAVVRYWLGRTQHLVEEDWVPNRVVLVGNYGTDLELKRELNRFLVSEDPTGRSTSSNGVSSAAKSEPTSTSRRSSRSSTGRRPRSRTPSSPKSSTRGCSIVGAANPNASACGSITSPSCSRARSDPATRPGRPSPPSTSARSRAGAGAPRRRPPA